MRKNCKNCNSSVRVDLSIISYRHCNYDDKFVGDNFSCDKWYNKKLLLNNKLKKINEKII